MIQENIQSMIKSVNGDAIYIRFVISKNVSAKTPLILVHGLSVSSRYMQPTIEAFSPFYSVYAPDLPGFGKSTKPTHILTIPELADALAACLRVLKLKKVILLGNSLGCQIIVDFTIRYPDLVKSIILIAPTTDPKGRSLWEEIKRAGINATKEPISYFPIALREYVDAGLRRTICTLQYGFQYKLEEKVGKIDVPTLLIRGDQDAIVPQYWVEQLHALIPNSEMKIITGAAHVVNFNSPDKLLKVVQAFLKKTE